MFNNLYVAIILIASLIILGREMEPKSLQLLILVLGLLVTGWVARSALSGSRCAWTIALLGATCTLSFFVNDTIILLAVPLLGYLSGRIMNAKTMAWSTASALGIVVFEGFSGPGSLFSFQAVESFSVSIVIFSAIYLVAAVVGRHGVPGRPNP